MRNQGSVETSIPHITRRTSRIAVGSSSTLTTTQLNGKKMNELTRAMKSSKNMFGGSDWVSNAGYRTRRMLSTSSLKSNGLATDCNNSQTFMLQLDEEDGRTFGDGIDGFRQLPPSSSSSSTTCHFSARSETGSSVSCQGFSL